MEHLTGNRQYVVETGQEELRAAEAIDTTTPAAEGAANNDLRSAGTALALARSLWPTCTVKNREYS